MWLPVHCSESGAETSAEMLLAALLPGLILATFLIQLIPTCPGIVGWTLLCQSTPKNRPTDIPEASLMKAIPPLTFSLPGCCLVGDWRQL